jgi:DNA polymerase III alpha subunit (gram-positive type)
MLLVLWISSLLQGASIQEAPPFLSQLEGRTSPPASPAEAPGDWLLAFVDVETTGLLPGYHEMIDIGMILTDVEGREIDRLFVRIQPEHPERTSEGARAVNAFDPDRWREHGALSPKDAVERIVSFHHRAADGKSVLLAAYNSHFDAAFIDHLFRGQGRTWRELYHYFILDLPSMAWSQGLRQLDGSALTKALAIEDEPHIAAEHSGLTGAEVNVRVYRALRERQARR